MGLRKDSNGPVVLVLASWRWVSTARLVLALAELGCRVDLVSPADHPAAATGAVRAGYRYDPLLPGRSLRSAIAASRPRAVIAADEVMVQHLEEMWWAAETRKTPAGQALQALIERSLGGREVLNASRSRMALLEIAQAQGVATPRTVSVEKAGQLETALVEVGFPAVLKADATSGGRGVRVVETTAEAHAAWTALHDPPSLPRAMVRGVLRKEWSHLHLSARWKTRAVTAQRFVRGPERTGMVACRDGEVLAAVCLEVVRAWSLRGPSSVVRVVEDKTMLLAMSRIARQLGISGFCGFDFIVAAAAGLAREQSLEPTLLIEMNTRPTQLAHLPLGPGRDLVAAYARGVLGLADAADRPAATTAGLIALFPQELQRDAASEFIEKGFHDVPWSSPELIKRALAGSPKGILKDRRRSDRAEAPEPRQTARLLPIKGHGTVL